MGKMLTQEQYEQRVYEAVGDKYKVVGTYQGQRSPITLFCNRHKTEFSIIAENLMRGPNDIRAICPLCKKDEQKERYKDFNTDVTCAYCGKIFQMRKSRLDNSKSGLYFCCREHKDLAQSLESGPKFNMMRPDFYGKTNNYRDKAFREYPHECAICGWNEDEDILQVHHIDSNRNNSKLENLIILCPICHWKITLGKYKLIGRNKLEKIYE